MSQEIAGEDACRASAAAARTSGYRMRRRSAIYKHWADKDALCLESIARVHGLDWEPATFDSGDLLLKHRAGAGEFG